MNKRLKTWLILGSTLCLVGVLLFVGVMSSLKWDFKQLSTTEYQSHEYVIQQNFQSISIVTNVADVFFAESNDGQCQVVISEPETMTHQTAVENGVLKIFSEESQDWRDFININNGTPTITIYLATNQLDSLSIAQNVGDVEIPIPLTVQDVNITLTTGDIEISDLSAGSITLFGTTGKIYANNVLCVNFKSVGDTGKINLNNVIAQDTLFIERSTGDINLNHCDADTISIQSDTGDVTGILLTGKAFEAETSTGDVDIPHSSTGGKCKIETSTGDIEIIIAD